MRLGLCAFLMGLAVSPALAGGTETLPACDDPAVLASIVDRQQWAEAETWHDGIVVTGVSAVDERVPANAGLSDIPARTCQARAELSTGRPTTLVYAIFGGMGFAGYGWKVDFCLAGHDPYRVYDAACRVLR